MAPIQPSHVLGADDAMLVLKVGLKGGAVDYVVKKRNYLEACMCDAAPLENLYSWYVSFKTVAIEFSIPKDR